MGDPYGLRNREEAFVIDLSLQNERVLIKVAANGTERPKMIKVLRILAIHMRIKSDLVSYLNHGCSAPTHFSLGSSLTSHLCVFNTNRDMLIQNVPFQRHDYSPYIMVSDCV